jgi:hypothetical protein
MGRGYFLWVSLILLALTLVGFGDNLFTDIHQPSNSQPRFIVHGLFSLGWTLILVSQAGLVRAGNVRLHRKIGTAAVLTFVGVALSTLYLFWVVWKGWDAMPPHIRANRILLPAAALLVWLGWANRRRPQFHKRLMLVATLLLMEPVISRTFDPLLVPFIDHLPEPRIEALYKPYLLTIWLGLFASLLLYDLRSMGRVHPVTAWGLLGFGAVWPVVLLS